MGIKKRNGIVLISVMFLTVLIGMYVASTLILSRGQILTGRQSRESQLAESAARSGIEYALARLEENAEWRGDGNGVVVDSASLTVVEDNGNVVGLIRGGDGSLSQFRLRFNYQDGSAGGDGLDDPGAGMAFDNPHVSVNNLINMVEVPLPMADGAGFSVESNSSGVVPPAAVALVCEGRVSPGLSSAGAGNPNPDLDRITSVRVLEGFYRVNEVFGDKVVEPAVSMAKNTNVKLYDGDASAPALLTIGDATGQGQPRTRTRERFTVENEDGSDGSVDGTDATILVRDPSTDLQAQLSSGVQGGMEDPNVAFYELTWDQIGEGSATSGDLQAGVYVYWESDGRVHYYDMNYEDYMTHIKANPSDGGTVDPALPAGLEFVEAGDAGPDNVTSEKHRFVVTDDLTVTPGANSEDLTIIPRSGAKETLDDSTGGGGGGGGSVTYNTNIDWPNLFQGPSTSASSSAKTNALVNNFVNVYFTSSMLTNALDVQAVPAQGQIIRGFLHELAPYGEISGPNGSIVWQADGTVTRSGDVRDTMQLFVSGASTAELKNYGAGQNTQFLNSSQAQTGDPSAIYDYLKAGSGATPANQISEIDLQGASDSLGAADFELTFAPQNETGIRITAPADVRVAADVRGHGASVKTKGELRFTGVGFDLRAEQNEEGPAISLYSEDNITISTLRKDENSGEYEYTGLDFRGIIYSWKDVNLLTGHADETNNDPQKVRIQGTVVAYGGEPGVDQPGDGAGGSLNISGDQVSLIFDPGYLVGLSGGTGLKTKLGHLSSSFRR